MRASGPRASTAGGRSPPTLAPFAPPGACAQQCAHRNQPGRAVGPTDCPPAGRWGGRVAGGAGLQRSHKSASAFLNVWLNSTYEPTRICFVFVVISARLAQVPMASRCPASTPPALVSTTVQPLARRTPHQASCRIVIPSDVPAAGPRRQTRRQPHQLLLWAPRPAAPSAAPPATPPAAPPTAARLPKLRMTKSVRKCGQGHHGDDGGE